MVDVTMILPNTDSVSFQLKPDFYEPFVKAKPDWGPVGEITYLRTYARPLVSTPERYQQLAKKYGVRDVEVWWLTVLRVVEGCFFWQKLHCYNARLPWDEPKSQATAEEMYRRMFAMLFLPPGRGLWMMGTDYIKERGSGALNNCAFVTTDELTAKTFADPFCFLMDFSMLGVGVGGDVLGGVPCSSNAPMIVKPAKGTDVHRIPDTREGWILAVRRLLNSFVGLDTWPASWDLSALRPAGVPIRGFGGTSSGPGPLEKLIHQLSSVLIRRVGQRLHAIDIADIFNLIGVCVVAGNVRRSAEILLAPANEWPDFAKIKSDPDSRPWGWASNNSYTVEDTFTDWQSVATSVLDHGEPGLVWLDNCRDFGRFADPANAADEYVMGVNPCAEQTLESGELCNLVETMPSRHKSIVDWHQTLKFAYLYAKTVTLIPTHDPRVNQITMRNRRIGASITGVTQAIEKFGYNRFMSGLEIGYRTIKHWDRTYSRWLCVPTSIKTTSVKPSGTVSLLPGVTPGMHWAHSAYYDRVIRFASGSVYVEQLKLAGYRTELTNEPNTTAVYFPVAEPYFGRGKRDVSIWEQIKLAADLQYWWADNAVSCTVTVQPEEARALPRAMEAFSQSLKTISFLASDPSEAYDHAPYQEISKEQYEATKALLKPVVLSGEHEAEDKFCDGEACTV